MSGAIPKNPDQLINITETEAKEEEEEEADAISEQEENDTEEWELDSEDTDSAVEEDLKEQPLTTEGKASPRKYAFKLKQNKTGNILTLHHLVEEAGLQLRIALKACCFNEQSNKMVVIDKRGNIFVFDFVSKRYWSLNFRVPKACLVTASPLKRSQYLVGNKLGQVFIIDVDKSTVDLSQELSETEIEEVSWSNRWQSKQGANTLIRFQTEALLLNLKTLEVTHQLEFDQSRYALKFAGFLPHSDQFFTCFTNDAINIWSSHSLKVVRMAQPLKARERRLRLGQEKIPEFVLHQSEESEEDFDCQDHDFAEGYLISYCFTPDGNKFALSCLDGYLLMLSSTSFEMDKMFVLKDFILKEMAFLPQPKERILIGLTSRNQVIMLDLLNPKHKLFVQKQQAQSLSLSRDGKLLMVLSKCGELNVWSTCRLFNLLERQTYGLSLMEKQLKPPKAGKTKVWPCLNEDLKHLLKPLRLRAMLKEFGCYPEKYRFLIWSRLLELPLNGPQYQALLKLGSPLKLKNQFKDIKIRQDFLKRSVFKTWSCLSQWCQVLAYAQFIPHLIYPFVQQLPKNGLVSFELLVSLLLNHFHLWFEFHPLPPSNYLALCENLLQMEDPLLCKFYQSLQIDSKDYAWSLLSNAFSEVLEESQWLILWDHLITEPPYFLIFVLVAYNLIHRELILRLPDRQSLISFFHEQNPLDLNKLLKRARKLMAKCPLSLHPKRFIQPFSPLPQGVYPKFLKYPHEWIALQEEQTESLTKQHQDIDFRLRHLELEEVKTMQLLQNRLKQEEHTRRLKEMEKLYQDTIQREEERLSCSRKMLLTYQMEVRQRKSEVLTQLQESEQRRKILEMEKDIDLLMHSIERERRRHNQQLQLAEDEIKNQEMELLAQRYYLNPTEEPLARKYYHNIQKLCRERDQLQLKLGEMTREQFQAPTMTANLNSPQFSDIERSIWEIQREFTEIIRNDTDGKT